ncbi:MAG: toxin-antitoxin system TumE family protein [Caldilineaceae bacterium]
MVIAQRSPRFAILQGAITWANGYWLTIREHLTLEDGPIVIEFYGYEVWFHDIKLYWYDSQAHPNDPTLASTHPHHKHVPPDIKHNRALKGTRSPRFEFYPAQSPLSTPGDRASILGKVNVL